MKTFSSLFIGVVLFMGLSCQQRSTALTDAQKAEIVKQVTERQTAFAKVFDEMNVHTFSQFLSQDHFSGFLNRLGWHLNKQALLDSCRTIWPRRQNQHAEQIMIKVYPLTLELAIADNIVNLAITDKNAATAKYQVSWTVTWQKEKLDWYIIHYHESWKEVK
jgi:hypothetical protein